MDCAEQMKPKNRTPRPIGKSKKKEDWGKCDFPRSGLSRKLS